MISSKIMTSLAQDVQELRELNNKPKEESLDFPQCRGMTFKEFWGWLHPDLNFHDEWKQLDNDMREHKRIWIKKCAGFGITTWFGTWIAWKCLKDNEWKKRQIDVNIPIIVGPRLDLAITIIQRIKDMFPIGSVTKTKEDTLILNGNKIRAYPSHHVAAAHGLNPLVVWADEGDFFPKGQQDKAREVLERYIAKTNPYLIWSSTPYLPGGLYEQIEEEPEDQCLYYRKFLLLDKALKVGHYTQEQVDIWKQSPSFMREAWGEYGYGVGDIFGEYVDDVIEEYSLERLGGRSGVYGDPGFGASDNASKFGICAGEVRDGVLYVLEVIEEARSSPSTMLDVIEEMAHRYDDNCKIDAAHAGFIRDLNERGVPAIPLNFGSPARQTEKSSTEKTNRDVNKETLKKIMPISASQMVKNKQIRIHPKFKLLISNMRAVKFDPKGGIDKSEKSFDIIDAFDMMCHDLKEFDYTSTSITYDGKIIGEDRPKSKSVIIKTEVVE